MKPRIYASMHLCIYASIYLSVECIKAARSAAEDSSTYIYIYKYVYVYIYKWHACPGSYTTYQDH